MIETIEIPSHHQGQRIDQVLAHLFPDYSRSKLADWLKEGFITVDQKTYKPKDRVHGGEQIALNRALPSPHYQPEAENIPLHIVFEDELLLVINKPAGLVVHPGAGNPKHTLVNALLHHHPSLAELPRAGLIHRLDKDTTGLLVVAKTLCAHTNLVRQMQARDILRQYVTLVHGHVIAGGTISTQYGRDPRNRLKMAVLKQGREAITQYRVRQQFQFATLLDINLLTGRTHQIRVHMAHLKHPVVGDPLYQGRVGVRGKLNETLRCLLQQFDRQALHACALSFLHPKTNTTITCNAPLPQDFQSLLTSLEANID